MPYATPSFGGFAIFGLAPRFLDRMNEGAYQENTYPGVNGVETIFLGGRGGTIEVTGLIYGANATSVAAWMAILRSYCDGVARTLVDTAGTSWLYAQMRTADPTGKRTQTAYYGSIQPYRCTFRVLT